ncbi:uncharacterized protein [Prorops nasuta]|uniref:uncharacterized protein n=1 Tax=Prorops nasuta TaxID=863751 RepID=UPI0034CDD38F
MSDKQNSVLQRLKGRFATKKQILKKQKIVAAQKRRHSKPKSTEELFPVQGRRIVEIETIAKSLWCKSCKERLFLDKIESSKGHGVAETFIIRCEKCLLLNEVPTSKQHDVNGYRRFDVNSKIALSALNGGMGISHVNKFLAGLNIPTMNPGTFKSYEREVGPQIENVARESCKEAAEIERTLTEHNLEDLKKLLPEEFHLPVVGNEDKVVTSSEINLTERKEVVNVILSYDMSWPKRGNGRNYDSLSGFGTFIGHLSGKVIDFGVRNKKCKKCSLGHNQEDHNCRLNFSGSAKAMEADVAATIVQSSESMKSANVKLGVFIGDEDASTLAAINRISSSEIIKWSDTNHVKACFSRALYRLATKHKELSRNSYQAVKYIKRNFSYAVHQNKKNPDSLKLAFQNLPAHVFNKHDSCGSWCKYVQDPSNYKHGLPKSLESQNLYNDLVALLQLYEKNTFKIAPCGSSQVNESVNNMIHIHAPKNRFYGGSESYDFRVAAGICDKNIGADWPDNVCKKLKLSPSSISKNYYNRRIAWNKWKAEKCKSTEYKTRRLELRRTRNKERESKENNEGINYESGIGLQVSNNIKIRNESKPPPSNLAVVLFDLETSGFGNAEILQIAAKCNQQTFCCYILPKNRISMKSTEVHGLSFSHGTLIKNGVSLPAIQLKDGLCKFLNFLISIGSACLLVAHNVNFDAKYLLNAINICKMESNFDPWIYGFADSLTTLKKVVKGMTNYKLTTLAEKYDLESNGAHDALVDVELLQQVLEKTKISKSTLLDSAKTFAFYLNRHDCLIRRTLYLQSLQVLDGFVSKGMITKMAEQAIRFENLTEAFLASDEKGIQILLGESINGRPRVTKNPKVIEKIVAFLKQHVK